MVDGDFGGLWPADYDGDGRTDLFTYSGHVVVQGDGPSFAANAVPEFSGHGIRPADVDGDGTTDALSYEEPAVGVHFNPGDGNLGPPVAAVLSPVPDAYLTTGDLTGDGLADLVAVVDGFGALGVWTGDGAGAFAFHQRLEVPAFSVVADDLDGDGALDLAATDGWVVSIIRGLGAGEFADPEVWDEVDRGASWVEASDLDGDGAAEVIFPFFLQELTPVHGFDVLWTSPDPVAAGMLSSSLVVDLATGDLDGDGIEEVVLAHRADQGGSNQLVIGCLDDSEPRACGASMLSFAPSHVATLAANDDNLADIVIASEEALWLVVM